MTWIDPDTIARILAVARRFMDGKLVESWVGGLNPLMYETWQAPAMAPLLLGADA